MLGVLIVDKHIDLNVYKEAKNLESKDELKSEVPSLDTKHEMRPACCGSSNSSHAKKENDDQPGNQERASDIDFNDWVGQYSLPCV